MIPLSASQGSLGFLLPFLKRQTQSIIFLKLSNMKKSFLITTAFAMVAAVAVSFANQPVSGKTGEPTPALHFLNPGIELPILSGDDSGRRLNFGVGLGRYAFRSGYKLSIPPIGISFDKPAFEELLEVDWLTSGGYVGFARYRYGSNFYDWNLTEITIASRWGISLSRLLSEKLPERLDLYGNLQIGYSLLLWDDTYNGAVGSGIYAGLTAGARLFLGKVGVFAEVGRTEGGLLRAGATFKL